MLIFGVVALTIHLFACFWFYCGVMTNEYRCVCPAGYKNNNPDPAARGEGSNGCIQIDPCRSSGEGSTGLAYPCFTDPNTGERADCTAEFPQTPPATDQVRAAQSGLHSPAANRPFTCCSRGKLTRRLDQGPFKCGECPSGYMYASNAVSMDFEVNAFASQNSCVDIGPRHPHQTTAAWRD